MKSKTPKKTASTSGATSGSRGKAVSGTKSASNARAAMRQSEKANANKANNRRSVASDPKIVSHASKKTEIRG
jgi:hypothetical protein